MPYVKVFGDRSTDVLEQVERWLRPVNLAARDEIRRRLPEFYGTFNSHGLTLQAMLEGMSNHQFSKKLQKQALVNLPSPHKNLVVYCAEASQCEVSWIENPETARQVKEQRTIVPFAYVFSFMYRVTRWSGQSKESPQDLQSLVQVYYYYTLGYGRYFKDHLEPAMFPVRRMEVSWDAQSREILKIHARVALERMEEAFRLQALRMRYPWEGYGNDNK